MSGDEYVKVNCTLIVLTKGSALIRSVKTNAEGWCPRSLMHAASDRILPNALTAPIAITLQIREWKIDELRLR